MTISITVFDSGAMYSGEITVDTAGTAEQMFSTSLKFHSIVIRAKAANTGQIYLGGSGVSSSLNDGLDAGEALEFSSDGNGFDLTNWYLDADTSGEGVDVYIVIGR